MPQRPQRHREVVGNNNKHGEWLTAPQAMLLYHRHCLAYSKSCGNADTTSSAQQPHNRLAPGPNAVCIGRWPIAQCGTAKLASAVSRGLAPQQCNAASPAASAQSLYTTTGAATPDTQNDSMHPCTCQGSQAACHRAATCCHVCTVFSTRAELVYASRVRATAAADAAAAAILAHCARWNFQCAC